MPQDIGPQFDAYESITVADTAIGFTAATRNDRPYAHITVESNPVRYRVDGNNPTALEGHLLNVGAILDLDSTHQLENIRFIRTGASATIRCSFGR